MDQRQNIYNNQQMPQYQTHMGQETGQPPIGQMMPQPPFQGVQLRQPQRNQPSGWRERWMRRFGMDMSVPMRKGELTIPKWIVGQSVVYFFIAMFACWAVYGYVPATDLILVSCISLVLFFFGGSAMSKGWSFVGEERFTRNLFIAGFLLRLIWVLYMYLFFYPDRFGNTYGDGGDVTWYMPYGEAIAHWIENGFEQPFSALREEWMSAIDDTGYPIWLGIIYLITGRVSDVFVPYLLKCIFGACCAISTYSIANRHFGRGTARLAAIFVCLNPNMIYWCGTMLKETEMVFLCCLAIDNFDRVLSSGRRYTFRSLLPGMLAASALFFFRSVLAIVIFLAVFAHIVMASRRVMSIGKKILAGVLVGAVLLLAMGDRIRTQSQHLIEIVQSDTQAKNMEWRAKQKEAEGRQQTFAQYASAVVFAPLIFTIPFPTFNQANEVQLLHVQLSGGNYIKNIMSFFVILVMLMMLISGEWRRHVFIISYTVGYLAVLVMSAFAQSGRFHMPIWPMLMLFSAYGVQVAKNNAKMRRWFNVALVLEVVVCLAWNWFKLKGRGMI